MTRKQIERAVSVWQERLGLQNWDVRVDWDKPAGENTNAITWRKNKYDVATVHFDPDCLKWDPVFLNQIVVHELLHLCTRDLDEAHKSVEQQLHRDAWGIYTDRYDHEIEGVIDRLAIRFVDLVGCA